MFSPFKNLISKFRKNASEAKIFSTATKSKSENNLTHENEVETSSEEKKTKHIEENEEKAKKMDKLFITDYYGDEDDDDIELQIKSVILEKPANCSSSSIRQCTNVAVNVAVESENQEHDCILINDDDDQDDDECEFIISKDSSIVGLNEESKLEQTAASTSTYVGEGSRIATNNNEFIYDEDEGGIFLNTSQVDEPYEVEEIITFSVVDLNTSFTSDAPLEDPLAIDEFPRAASNEVSIRDDLPWMNMDITNTNTNTTNKSAKMTPQEEKPPHQEKEKHHSSCTSKSHCEDNVEELRSDGSDSGLGSEISSLQTTLTSVADTSQLSSAPVSVTHRIPIEIEIENCEEIAKSSQDQAMTSVKNQISIPPRRSNLKRRLELEEAEDVLNSPNTAIDVSQAQTMLKKPKRSINFENVQVYYFPRQQGFGCVPSAGGCTLGMTAQHVAFKTLTLAEHAAELRRAHRTEISTRGSSSDDSEESEEDYLSEGSGSDMDAESSGYLQPLSPKQRRALLKAAGVRKIDASEKLDCRDIRNSREVCGCSCRDFCDPETCACSQAGIKCQVDRTMFPCGCLRDSCGNGVGRIEFNPARVRTHYIHTVMRLEMENRQQQNPPPSCGGVATTVKSASCNVSARESSSPLGFYGLQQQQSNYSSGYASPAYTNDSVGSYYQQASTSQYGHTLTSTQTPQYQLDSLDTTLFSSSVSATPSYGELMPAYGNLSATTITPSAYLHRMNYSSADSGGSIPTQVVSYPSFHHQTSANYIPQQLDNNVQRTFSSCSVPSVPPFGSATTTSAEASHPHLGNNENFISLNTPIVSSSRISQINDLLLHNRNTTGALVAVSQCANLSGTLSSFTANTNSIISTVSAISASIDTPPIELAHKSCLAFEELTPPLNPTPIVAVLENMEFVTKPIQTVMPLPPTSDVVGIIRP